MVLLAPVATTHIATTSGLGLIAECHSKSEPNLAVCIQSDMHEAEEREYIRQATETLKQHTDKAPKGWLGPWISESHVTLDLLQVFQNYPLCCVPMHASRIHRFQLPNCPLLPRVDKCHSMTHALVYCDSKSRLGSCTDSEHAAAHKLYVHV